MRCGLVTHVVARLWLCYTVRHKPRKIEPVLPAPNAVAYLVLLSWPVVAYLLWARLDPARALIWTVLAGYLLLPPLTVLNLPVVPDLDKSSVPNLMSLALAIFLLRDRISFLPESIFGKAFIALYVLVPFGAVLTNADPIPIEAQDIQGMRIYDSVAAVANQAIVLLPFFLARRYLATDAAMRAIVMALVAAGLAYSVPMLLESRLSPRLNVWIYGFFQHDFFQTIRFGGYRPVVFLPHGLWVAFFAMMCFVASVLVLRLGPAAARPRYALITPYLALMVIICKSAGPVIYALILAPIVLFVGRRWQLLFAAVLAVTVVVYPLLRGAQLVPMQAIVDAAQEVNADRAASFAFRVDNEEQLLARAQERPWFGWGGYGRNLIHDPITGRTLTIADGAWIIVLGTYGWLGYIAEFGLLALPLLLLGREALVTRSAAFSPFACVVALILGANMMDMLPNATLIPFTWLIAGALLGYAEAMQAARRNHATEEWRASLHMGRPSRTVI